jgi:hypothetical protein
MILEKLIKSIKEGEITSPDLIATLLEVEMGALKTALDLAYANGRVDALKGESKSSYSEWKYGQNNDTDISNSQN